MHQTFCISERVYVFMFGICIFRRRFFPLGTLRHISVFKTCRVSRQSLDTASFPARTLPSLIFFQYAVYVQSRSLQFCNSFLLRHYFIACMLAFSFLVPNKHNWSCPSYFMCCCLSADQNLNVFSAAERSDIAEKGDSSHFHCASFLRIIYDVSQSALAHAQTENMMSLP